MTDKKYSTHFFICTHTRESGESCGQKGSAQLRDNLKSKCKSLGPSVRINAAGCLGHCEEGIACVLYPEGRWYLKQKSNSEEFLFQEVASHVKHSNQGSS